MTRFRAFILWAVDNGYTVNNPFKNFTISEIVYGTPIYISNEERKQLLETDLSADSGIETQRDIFVFQCLVGCRVGDYFKMTYSNIVDRVHSVQDKRRQAGSAQAIVRTGIFTHGTQNIYRKHLQTG